ncbi:MAG: sulfatase [Lentisphaerae bacterium RIFOXYA12_FULL_48_11]|nr:MAG: sulfatase [Lentisphaerae bacterium RIFOXYA12_FULL_48_11]
MNRREFLKTAVIGLTGLSLSRAAFSAAGGRKPNFIFFLVDDLGWTDLRCFGSKFYDTPNIDRLCSSGLKFTDAYAACPVCSPTRASIMTGKYTVRTGVTDYIGAAQPDGWKRNTKCLPAIYNTQLNLEEVTIAEAMKEGGYSTGFFGKWHLGPETHWPEHQGFDVNMGGHSAGGPYGPGKYFVPYGNPRLSDGPSGEHLPDRLAREAVRFVEKNREQNKPFLAYLAFYSVHTPLMARKDLQEKYEKRLKELGSPESRFGDEPPRAVRLSQDHAIYAGMVEAMDQAVGKVLDALDKLGLADNTVVIFMSDNGGLSTSEGSPTSNLPLRAGKGWLYEGGIREPVIVRWPGVTKAGSICSSPISSVDFYPTILELAGLSPRLVPHCDGMSFVPLLKGESMQRGPIFWHYPHYGNQGGAPGSAVREGPWKLIEWLENGGRYELFNLQNDIGEQNNLADQNPDKVRELSGKIKAWRKAAGALMPAKNPTYDPAKPDGREAGGKTVRKK